MDKIQAGRARKQEKKDMSKAKQALAEEAAEDDSWDGGAKKQNKKKAADAERKERAAERKAAASEQEAEEDVAGSAPKKGKGKSSKMSRADIAARVMAEAEEKEKEEKRRKKQIAHSGGDEYIGEILANVNKESAVSASGVDDAIAVLKQASLGAGDASPGPAAGARNIKAAYEAFEERELPQLKMDNPGLKHSQYKDRLSKMWAKSPENPNNA